MASVRAADAAERVHAHGEAGALLERALDLWSRVPDAMEQVGCDRIELVRRASRALINDGAHGARRGAAQAGAGRGRRAARAARWRPGCSSCCRARSGRSVAPRTRATRSPAPSTCCPRTRPRAPSAPASSRARRRSRCCRAASARCCRPPARRSPRPAEADAGPRADALNAMGLSLVLLGDVEEGSDRLREAIAISPVGFERTSAWSNLADALHLVGRSQRGARRRGAGPGRRPPGPGRGSDWLTMTLGEIRWDLGEWAAARRRLPPGDRRHVGITFAYVELKRAEVALADAEHEPRARRSTGSPTSWWARASRSSSGWPARCAGELERRGGDLAAARAAVDDGLDAIEFCSEDLAADRAHVGDRRRGSRPTPPSAPATSATPRPSARRSARAEGFVMRAEACASDGRPVEAARLASARAHLARARGAADPELDAAAAEAWRALARPYQVAIARAAARGDARVARRPRGRRRAARRRARRREPARGGVAARRGRGPGRPRAAADAAPPEARSAEVVPDSGVTAGDPFGLTPRERQVLALVADGATNREIGAQLYMAEKTASVHVSRILAKLDVRSRTEAAAVAHRLGFGEPRRADARAGPRLGGMATPQQPIDSGFGARSTAAEVLEGIDLSGRLAIVTGGYSGLGLETVRALSGAGADVIVPARRREHAVEVLAGVARVEVEALDLGDLDSVRACAQQRARRRPRRRHPHQQRRDHGVPRDARRAGLGGAVRHQPPRPLRARERAVAAARRRRRRARGRALVDRAQALADPLRRPACGRRRTTRSGRPTVRRRPPTACSPSSSTRSARTPACAPSRRTPAGS